MSYLLFIDESGHDHRNVPYEVRGGLAIHASRLWSFVSAMKSSEESIYGDALHRHGTEIKGHKLLDKDRFKWAAQDEEMDSVARRKHALAFLNTRTDPTKNPRRREFTAYGQASLAMTRSIFKLLRDHEAV